MTGSSHGSNQLRYFIAVSETRSFTRTAENVQYRRLRSRTKFGSWKRSSAHNSSTGKVMPYASLTRAKHFSRMPNLLCLISMKQKWRFAGLPKEGAVD